MGLRFDPERFNTEEGREALVRRIEELARGIDTQALGCLEHRTVEGAFSAHRETRHLSRLLGIEVTPDLRGEVYRCDFVRDGSAYSAAVIPCLIGENGSSVSVPVISLMEVDPKIRTTVATADFGTKEYRGERRPFRVCQTGPARFYDGFPVDRMAVYNRLQQYAGDDKMPLGFFDFPRIGSAIMQGEAAYGEIVLRRAA